MIYNFIKNKSSFGRIFGASILALVMLVTAIFALVVSSPDPIKASVEDIYDFGDAWDSLNTTLANDGARHINDSGYFLGSLKDNESDGQPSPGNGDDTNGIDDEDGVSWTPFHVKQGEVLKITVTTTVPAGAPNGNLSVWFDLNANYSWDEGEQILKDVSLGTGVFVFNYTIPCSARHAYTYLRFRFSTDTGLSYKGAASNGEVEDYRIYILEEDELPSQSIEFGEPKIERVWRGGDYYVVGPNTPVWINSSDACPGTERIEFSAWVADDLEDPIVWTFLWNDTVYDGDDDDLNDTFGSVSAEFYNDETCLHEVRYQCWDYDNESEGVFSEDFFVDKCGPITTKVVGCPTYSGSWPPPPWLSGNTPLYFSSVDDCCLPNGTAVEKIIIKVWWKYDTCDSSGALNVIETIVVEDGDDNDTNPAEGMIGYTFHFKQTGYYELEYWGVDMMGNKESHHKQQHRVDFDPPEITKTYPEGGYYEIEEHEGFIKCCKPINLTVEEMPDDTCNAGLYGMFWRYDWNETYYPAAEEAGAVNGSDIVETFCIADPEIALRIGMYWWYPYEEEIHFLEECEHDLRYFAIDNVGNVDEIHNQNYYVDNTPPDAIKEIGEPKCRNSMEDDAWCVKEETPIWINVTDNGTEPCIVGSVYLHYRLWYEGQWEDYHEYVPEGTLSVEIHLENECMHKIAFYVEDNVGNRWPEEGYHIETFYVDESEPIIFKEVGEPNCQLPMSNDYCVNLSTLITLNATEVGCCQNDTVTIEYRIWAEEEGWTNWTIYEEPFNFTEECKHYLEVRAYDCLGNEEVDNETFYVDETPPEIIKEVGEPKCTLPDSDDYCVNFNTEITLDATNGGCCPSEDATLEYRIWWEEEGWTDWMIYEIPFTFWNECKHYLEVRAEDCIGNKAFDNETFYVDETPPIITKTIGEPNCPIPGTDDYCVNLSTLIALDAVDQGCCQNGTVTLEYRIFWDVPGVWMDDWVPYEGPFNFTYECMHYLEVRATDCLGNEVVDNETFYVDETPPKIIKEVGEPNCQLDESDNYCVNLSTNISLDVLNQGCCQNDTYTLEYRIWWEEEGWTNWTVYEEPFNFSEECMHYLEIRAADCLGNEEVDNETFFVDDSPPIINKLVGEPNCPILGTNNYCVNLSTLITLDDDEQGCCPNENVVIQYRIWWKEEGWTEWMEYEEPFNFSEECMHYLEINITDCVGNSAFENETFYVDEQVPDIFKTIWGPNCTFSDLENPGFETGDFTGWSIEENNDNVTVEMADNYTMPFTGMYMARLGDDNGGYNGSQPMGYNEISQVFTATQPTFKFTYNIFTFDYTGYDLFYYLLETADGITTIASYSQTAWGSGTDLKTTGWTSVEIDISAYIGEDLEFYIGCGGTKDTAYPTWAYVDFAPDYCVTTETEIAVTTMEYGCGPCDNVTVTYRIWNITDGWTEWMDYEETISFDEECKHYLEIKALDCLGNTDIDNETFYVDETAPNVTKSFEIAYCPIPGTDDYCVNTKTSIYVEPWQMDCCPFGNVTVDYKIWNMTHGWTDWIPYEGYISFDEECKHYLLIRVRDCLGNEYIDNETFYVDETPPEIFKEVGEPNCLIPGTEDYCVNLSTPITINATNRGCCVNESIKLEYRIWWEEEGWTDWMIYEGPFTFWDECKHYLEIRASDCLGNEATDNETFYVDETDPVIVKTIGEPNCVIEEGVEYCVTNETVITIDAYDEGCCDDLTVKYRINGGGWVDITEMLPYNLSFEEECNHTLEIWAYDCLGHEDYDSELFHVDMTDPVIVKTIGDPHCVIEEGEEYCVNLSTIITIDVYDEGCCDSNLTVWYRYTGGDLVDISNMLPYNFTFDKECKHELEIWVWDCLGNEIYDNETFYVDEQPPILNKSVGDPHVYLGEDEYGHDIWLVYPETDICFEAEDQGCCEGGGTFIYYRYWYLGNWTDWMEYEGCINLEKGCVNYLEAYATDCLGNAGWIDNETFWVCGPGGGSDDPNVEIIFPEHGSTQNTDVVEVILHAYDDETKWDDLGVFLWIPGGRRDAPFLYYDVEQIPGQEDYFRAYVPIYWYQGGAQITLEAIALDEDGNTGVAIPVTFTVDSTIVWDQWMQYGWNKLELPKDIGCNESIERVLYSINGSYEWVFHYDKYADPQWTSYSPNLNPIFITLWEIIGGEQYWVNINKTSGLRYYIGIGEIEILYPEDGAVLFDLNEINGTTWNSETGMEEVHIQIYYKDEGNTKHYWNGSDWVLDSTYLPCDLESGYIQNWSFDSSGVAWIPGETFYVKARGTDKFWCYAYDMVSFEFEKCICVPGIDLEKHVWDGEGWSNETHVLVEEEALFNISIHNDGETISGSGGGNGGGEPPVFNETINQAIEDGLAWLVNQQDTSGGANHGTWTGYGSREAGTGLALYKLCERAYELGYDSPFDPEYEYYQNVMDGFNWTFTKLSVYDISLQDHTSGATGTVDDPDTNGNGKGVASGYGTTRETYYTGIFLAAISASDTFDRVIDVSGSPVDGWTFGDVAQDMVDFLAWAQVDPVYSPYSKDYHEGGWDYYHVDNGSGGTSWKGDQSNSGYAMLGLAEAQDFGCTVPDWVKTELDWWIDWVQDDIDGDIYDRDGGSWYSYSGDGIGVNILKTGNLIFQMAFVGDTPTDSRVIDALDYLTVHWNDSGGSNSPPGWRDRPGKPYSQYQAMFCAMKGLEYMGIDTFDGIDWFKDFSDAIIDEQVKTPGPTNGSWQQSSGRGDAILITEWALLTLERIAPEVVSDCPPCNLTDWYGNDTLPEGLAYVENSTKITVISCCEYYQSNGSEVQPQVTYNADGTTTLEWLETGEEPFNLSLCTTMYIEFNATVLDCEAPDGHINTAYIIAYSPDDDSWVSDDDTAIVWGECVE